MDSLDGGLEGLRRGSGEKRGRDQRFCFGYLGLKVENRKNRRREKKKKLGCFEWNRRWRDEMEGLGENDKQSPVLLMTFFCSRLVRTNKRSIAIRMLHPGLLATKLLSLLSSSAKT